MNIDSGMLDTLSSKYDGDLIFGGGRRVDVFDETNNDTPLIVTDETDVITGIITPLIISDETTKKELFKKLKERHFIMSEEN